MMIMGAAGLGVVAIVMMKKKNAPAAPATIAKA